MRSFAISAAAAFALALTIGSSGFAQSSDAAKAVIDKMTWTGQFALRWQMDGKTIQMDPIQIEAGAPVADIVLISHAHGDHYSVPDLKKVIGPKTMVYAPADIVAMLKTAIPEAQTAVAEIGKFYKAGAVTIQPVPAYNIVKIRNHPQGNKWVGYVVSDGKTTFYLTGDTERVPEMKNISTDVIFLPLGQTYTMENVDDAVATVKDVKAKIAIPVHWGMYEGTQADVDSFIKKLEGSGIQVMLLKRGK